MLQPDESRQFSIDSSTNNVESNSNKTEMEEIERTISFRDNFNDGSLGGWKTIHGNWEAKNGRAVQSSNHY